MDARVGVTGGLLIVAMACGPSPSVCEVPSLRVRRVEQALVDRALADEPSSEALEARRRLLAQIGRDRRIEARFGRALARSTARWIDWFREEDFGHRLRAEECRGHQARVEAASEAPRKQDGSADPLSHLEEGREEELADSAPGEGPPGEGDLLGDLVGVGSPEPEADLFFGDPAPEGRSRWVRPAPCEHALAVLEAVEESYRFLSAMRFDERDLALIWTAVERAAGSAPACEGPSADPRLRAVLFFSEAFRTDGLSLSPLRTPRCLRVPTVFGWLVPRAPECGHPMLATATNPEGARLIPSQDPATDRRVLNDLEALGVDGTGPATSISYPRPRATFHLVGTPDYWGHRFSLLSLREGAGGTAPPTAFAVVGHGEVRGFSCVFVSQAHPPPAHCGRTRSFQVR